VFLVSWLLVPLLILCIVQVRLWLFVLPLLVPMTLGIGRALQFVAIKRWMAAALGLWMLLMLGFKGYAPALENHYENLQTLDAREFAEAIQSLLPARGERCELAFFEATPVYGLKFYTGCNLLRVAHTQPRDTSFDLRFEDQTSSETAPNLWLMESHDWQAFQAAADQAGLRMTALQTYRGYQIARLAPR
jgi:hypothetical protein